MEKPWRLYFHHVQSQASVDRRWSYGVSVRHDVYGFIYLKHVLPGYASASRLPEQHSVCHGLRSMLTVNTISMQVQVEPSQNK